MADLTRPPLYNDVHSVAQVESGGPGVGRWVCDHDPVTEETLDEHITALRDQLGVFYDYVQTVPHIGYRFKA